MTSPLLARLTDDFGYQSLNADTLDAFLVDQEHCVLFFAGDPARYPETLDVAVILPELIHELGGRLTPAVIAPDAEQAWPACTSAIACSQRLTRLPRTNIRQP